MGAGQVRTAQAQRESGGASRKTVSTMPETKSPSDPLREAQQFLGNQGILKRLQAKLTVNQPSDVYEQEADRVADTVMAKPAGMAAVAVRNVAATAAVQKKCASCESGAAKCPSCEEEEQRVMRKESGSAAVPVAGAAVTRVLNSPGQPLERSTRSLMEGRFGYPFGDVRVHTGIEAARSAREIAAKAYTVGSDVVFNDGQYRPWSPEGQRLLAHELTHVLQQREGGAAHSGFALRNSGVAAKPAMPGNAQAQRVPIREPSERRIARDEDKTPWWKKKLNPLYQAALEKLPKEAAEKLEQANAVAKEFVQSTGLSDQTIDQAVQVAEPVLKPLEDKLGVTSPVPPPPKKEDKTPVVWLGQPPIDVRLQQRREQKAAQDKLDRTDPGALAHPVKKDVTQDLTDQSYLLREDPPPTEFESKLRSGKKFTHTLTPHADIRPSQSIWLGHRPPDSQLDSMQYTAVGMPSSTKIWEHDKSFDVQISGDDVTPVRDPVTHELKGYRFHLTGETIAELNRDGEILESHGTERPLETPAVDPIDAALLVVELGPLAAKGIQAGGKALLDAALKSGTRELGEVGGEETGSVVSRELPKLADAEVLGDLQENRIVNISDQFHPAPNEVGDEAFRARMKRAVEDAMRANRRNTIGSGGETGARSTTASTSLDLNAVEGSFPQLDLISKDTLASVKAFSVDKKLSSSTLARYDRELRALRTPIEPGVPTKLGKAADIIASSRDVIQGSGAWPRGLARNATPEQIGKFANRQASIAIPADHVADVQAYVAARARLRPLEYGLTPGEGLEEGIKRLTSRIQSLGLTSQEIMAINANVWGTP